MRFRRRSRFGKRRSFRSARRKFSRVSSRRRGRRLRTPRVSAGAGGHKLTKYVSPTATICPDETYVKLRFTQIYAISQNVTGYNKIILWGNNPRHPQVSPSASGSAYGYPEWINFYYQYRGIGSRIKVECFGDNTNYAPTTFCVVPNLSGTDIITTEGFTNLSQVCNLPYAKSKDFQQFQGNTLKDRMITSYMGSNKIYGIGSKAVFEDFTWSTQNAADPANVWYWHVYFFDYNETSGRTVWARVTVDYYVKFEHRVNFAS